MPYNSIKSAKDAGFPTSADDIDLTLGQINKLASIYDAVKAQGEADNPMAVAWSQWKKLYKKSGGKWIANTAADPVPDGYEVATLAFKQPAVLNYTDDQATGDTVFHDVVLLAEGTWTDGHNRKPIHYSGSDLAKMTFEKRIFKANHDIFDDLPIQNHIGIIENERFTDRPTPRWIGDVRIYPTQNGKDTITLLKRGAITDFSSELYAIHEKVKGKTYAKDILFMGAAPVRTGACSVCTFNEGVEDTIKGVDILTKEDGAEPGSEDMKADTAVLQSELETEKTAEIKALEAQLAEAKKLKKNQLASELTAANMKISELEAENRQLKRELSEIDHKSRAAELQRQIDELKREPVMHTRIMAPQQTAHIPAELDTGEFEPVYVSDMEK